MAFIDFENMPLPAPSYSSTFDSQDILDIPRHTSFTAVPNMAFHIINLPNMNHRLQHFNYGKSGSQKMKDLKSSPITIPPRVAENHV